MKSLFPLALLLCGISLSIPTYAQCNFGSQNIIITDQLDIDNFQLFLQNFYGTSGTCTDLVFDPGFGLVIFDMGFLGPDITELNGLSDLTSITGSLFVLSTGISDLTGLDNLTSVSENFVLFENPDLLDITALDMLNTIGNDLDITANISLTSLDGLEDITTIGGDFFLYENDDLADISALANLQSVTGDLDITFNLSLGDLTGLEGLQTVGGYLYLDENTN